MADQPKYEPHRPTGPVTQRDLVRMTESVSRVLDHLHKKKHLVDSVLLEGIELVTGSTNLIEHKLGRAFRGWCLYDMQADARVYRDTTSTADPAKFLPLLATANAACALVVF